MPTTQAFVTPKKGSLAVESQVVERPACGASDVVVEIIASGLCRSDIDYMKDLLGASTFPLVAGHEGVGRIVEVGEKVKTRKVGQLVGLGYLRDSCQGCRLCNSARENLCPQMTAYTAGAFNKQQGTFAEFCVSPEKFAYPIPEGLDPVAAAPLVCAGITVYSPLATYATHVSKVLINSLGGLGSLAVQFAAKMGCEVVVMSRGTKKKDQALSFGAHGYIDSTDAEQMRASEGRFDLILDTSPATADMQRIMPLLRTCGHYTTVGIPEDGKKMEIGNFDLVPGGKHINGSIVGSVSQMEDMMVFAARHGIVADCETMPMSQLSEATEKLEAGQNTKMRIVLVREDKLEALKKSQGVIRAWGGA